MLVLKNGEVSRKWQKNKKNRVILIHIKPGFFKLRNQINKIPNIPYQKLTEGIVGYFEVVYKIFVRTNFHTRFLPKHKSVTIHLLNFFNPVTLNVLYVF